MADTENSAQTAGSERPALIGLVRDPLTGHWALWNSIDDNGRPADAQYVVAELADAWKHDRDDARANLNEALEANAAMLEALRAAQSAIGHCHFVEEIDGLGGALEQVDAAIAKAEGRGEGE